MKSQNLLRSEMVYGLQEKINLTKNMDHNNNEEKVYKCPECGLHYENKDQAKKCEEWCKEHHSCNLEIISDAVENKQNK